MSRKSQRDCLLNEEVTRDMSALQEKVTDVQEHVDELEEKAETSRYGVKTPEDEKEKLDKEYDSMKREIETFVIGAT